MTLHVGELKPSFFKFCIPGNPKLTWEKFSSVIQRTSRNGLNALPDFMGQIANIKVLYSEKATKFSEISTLLLFYVVPVKSKGRFRKILWPSQNMYMNFKVGYVLNFDMPRKTFPYKSSGLYFGFGEDLRYFWSTA